MGSLERPDALDIISIHACEREQRCSYSCRTQGFMYEYIHMYVYRCVSSPVCAYENVHIYMCVNVQTYISHMRVCVCVYMYVYMHVCVYM